jgi:hypothetical protein
MKENDRLDPMDLKISLAENFIYSAYKESTLIVSTEASLYTGAYRVQSLVIKKH